MRLDSASCLSKSVTKNTWTTINMNDFNSPVSPHIWDVTYFLIVIHRQSEGKIYLKPNQKRPRRRLVHGHITHSLARAPAIFNWNVFFTRHFIALLKSWYKKGNVINSWKKLNGCFKRFLYTGTFKQEFLVSRTHRLPETKYQAWKLAFRHRDAAIYK